MHNLTLQNQNLSSKYFNSWLDSPTPISDWTLKKLVATAANNAQILEANFKAYLDGFSDDVKEIIDKFDLRNQIRKMSQSDVLLDVLEKFTSPEINLSPHEVTDNNGRKLAGLTNLGMGYVFEELIRVLKYR